MYLTDNYHKSFFKKRFDLKTGTAKDSFESEVLLFMLHPETLSGQCFMRCDVI